jgi:hypothetical protein
MVAVPETAVTPTVAAGYRNASFIPATKVRGAPA